MRRIIRFPVSAVAATLALAFASGDDLAASLEERACQQFREVLQQTPRGVMPLSQLSHRNALKIVEPAAMVNADNAESVLRGQFGFTASAIDSARSLWEDNTSNVVWVARTTGAYPIVVLTTLKGTLHCGNFAFFALQGRQAVPIAGPTLDATYQGVCWDVHGDVVEMSHEALFLVSTDDTTTAEVIAFHVTGPAPVPPFCHLTIDFNVEFEVSDSSCKRPFCADLKAQLPALAERFASTGTADLEVAETAAAAVPVAILDRLRQRYGYVTLPLPPLRFYRVDIDNDRFDEFLAIETIADRPKVAYVIDSPGGAFLHAADITVTGLTDMPGEQELTTVPTDEKFRSSHVRFDDPIDYFPFVSSSTTYLARIGGGSFGGRMLDGYLLGVYDLTGGHVAPIAGFALTRVNASVKSVKALSE